ncbi:hypothetical protein [Mesorhizobium mediterraneum]|uniref:hypothetical protein n=1 Tax=Mesorhizobium mediterraneum TaxID=43617 RepID=UPI00177E59F4|nr:hypothetical protein [Mesorhizobium mediterraneum]
MQAEQDRRAATKPTARSRVTNGSAIVPDADGRSTWVRRLRDLIAAHEEDLGGTESLTQAQRSIVRRAATLSVELERLEASFAMAGLISAQDLDAYQRASNSLRRLLESLGIEPKVKDAQTVWGEVFQASVDRTLTPQDKAVGVGRDGLSPVEREQFDAWRKTVEQENAANDR